MKGGDYLFNRSSQPRSVNSERVTRLNDYSGLGTLIELFLWVRNAFEGILVARLQLGA